MLIEIIEMAVSGGLFSAIGYYVGKVKAKQPEPKPPPNRIPWNAKLTTTIKDPNKENWYLQCPKCTLLVPQYGQYAPKHPQFCQCDGTEHFHYECSTCGFKAFMDPPTTYKTKKQEARDSITEEALKEVEECLKK